MSKKIKEIFEFNIGLSHIIILACFLVIFSYVFYQIGYNAGNKKRIDNYTQVKKNDNQTTISFKDNQKEKNKDLIKEEMDRHKRFIKKPDGTTEIKPKTIKRKIIEVTDNRPNKEEKKDKKKEVNKKSNKKKINKSTYSIQVGAFNNHKEAKQFANKFIKLSYPAEIKPVKIKNNNWHRVYVGKFNTREEAEKTKIELQKKVNKKDFFITKIK